MANPNDVWCGGVVLRAPSKEVLFEGVLALTAQTNEARIRCGGTVIAVILPATNDSSSSSSSRNSSKQSITLVITVMAQNGHGTATGKSNTEFTDMSPTTRGRGG